MTLVDHEYLGGWDYFRTLIEDLELTHEFEKTWNAPISEYDLEVSEAYVIEETLDAAEDRYILVVTDRPPTYQVLLLVDD